MAIWPWPLTKNTKYVKKFKNGHLTLTFDLNKNRLCGPYRECSLWSKTTIFFHQTAKEQSNVAKNMHKFTKNGKMAIWPFVTFVKDHVQVFFNLNKPNDDEKWQKTSELLTLILTGIMWDPIQDVCTKFAWNPSNIQPSRGESLKHYV